MEMKVFENHNSGMYSTSYVIGNYCRNGCQFFHKDEAQKVFDEFNVPQEYRDDIMNAFSDEEIPYLEKDKEHDFIKYKMFLAKLGRKQDLDILVNDGCWIIRKEVAEHRYKEHLNILVCDSNNYVNSYAQMILNRIKFYEIVGCRKVDKK